MMICEEFLLVLPEAATNFGGGHASVRGRGTPSGSWIFVLHLWCTEASITVGGPRRSGAGGGVGEGEGIGVKGLRLVVPRLLLHALRPRGGRGVVGDP